MKQFTLIMSFALLSLLLCVSTIASEKKETYPSLEISKEFGYKPTKEELAGKASYQDKDWKETEREIAKDPKLFKEQREAIRYDMQGHKPKAQSKGNKK